MDQKIKPAFICFIGPPLSTTLFVQGVQSAGSPQLGGKKKGAKIYGDLRGTCDENYTFVMIKTGSGDETLPLQTRMHGYKNDELVDGEVNWLLIPSAR